ncbi:MAG: GPW/gp25 family protein [Bacteroidota bacterium]
MEEVDIIGSGWTFPPAFDKPAAGVVLSHGVANVTESLGIIVNTRLGERILRPEFGSETHELVFKPFNANMRTYLQESLRNAVEEHEPRVTVESVAITQPNPLEGRIEIAIAFTVISTNESENLVLPYYLPDLA